MKLKSKIITILICAIIVVLYFLKGSYEELAINKVYNVYLEGNIIGTITSQDDLYNLIDNKQQGIKEKYDVDTVYPPSSLKIVESYSYNPKISNIEDIYNKIEELQDFNIKGYEIQISKTDNHDEIYIYVLDKKVLEDAIKDFILAFISEDDLNNYLKGKQINYEDIGTFYEDMGIEEDITIREKYISVNNKIYDDSAILAQELLFGFDYEEKTYTVKEGDTIESISEDNTLNTQEFLIANPKYTSKDSLLAIGEKVNVNLISPLLAFTYTVTLKEEKEYKFETEIQRDNTKEPSYHEVTQPGVNGIYLETSHYKVTNGEQSTQVDYDTNRVTIRETVNQIEVRGRQAVSYGTQVIIDNGEGWKWPTTNPFTITSEFAPRWGKHHNGMDISGTEHSNVFAVTDGVVITAVNNCPNEGYYGSRCGSGFGNHVIIDHGNNLYTIYGHMYDDVTVQVGQSVTRGTVLGHMGNSGSSKGVHLHFGVAIGTTTNYVNPRSYLFR